MPHTSIYLDSHDSLLVEKLLNGDLVAFDVLFDKYGGKLYGFSLRYLKSEIEAEELVQNVFIKVWENRHKLRKDASFKSYLFTIAYNDILKFFRTKATHQNYVSETLLHASPYDNSFEKADYASTVAEIDKIIERLPARCKEVFIKSRKEGKTSKEIAAELNISSGTVDNYISDALKTIRQSLSKELIALVLYYSLFVQ